VKICFALTILSLVIAGAASAADINPVSHGLEIAGSSTVQPLAELVGELYHKKYGAPVRIKGGGTMAGIESVLSGAADIGLVSRALKDSEKAGLDYATIGHDAVVIIVNSGNPVSEMRRDQLVALFSGTARNWKELGGRDETVLLISKLPGRSTLELFEEYTALRHPSRAGKSPGGPISKSAYEIGSNLESATLVGGLPGAVGYVSMGTALSLIQEGMPLKILSLDGIKGTRENVINGGYPVRRDLNLVFKKANRKVKRFIGIFLEPEGQRILMDHGFIPAKGGRAD
jgi:phosphate transport system substrate-binding protein